jgi:predicted nucleic acid-binding protein
VIVIDSSIWIDHLNHGDPIVLKLLSDEAALMHPFVLGEIALSFLQHRRTVLAELGKLPSPAIADDHEVINMVETKRIFGSGIGYVDAHLIAACLLTSGTYLWTRDRRLADVAARLGIDAGAA